MRLTTALLALAVSAGLTHAAAADGWYASAGTGVNYVPSMKVPITGSSPDRVSTDLGMAITAAGGYAFGPIRLEEEFGWRTNTIDKARTLDDGTRAGIAGGGNFTPLSLMTNLYYDIDTGSSWTPYIGAGVGGVDLGARIAQGGTTVADSSAIGFGYQGIAGVAYKINDRLSLKADYRYFATTETDLPANGPGHADVTYGSHAIMVGFIYNFGSTPAPMPETATSAAATTTPAPAPAPAPAAAPATTPAPHQFMVFFDFDKSDITPEARQIIEQAAAVAKSAGVARIDLTGHTDTVGSIRYNQKLSVRRAEAVKKVLVELGIGSSEIGVVGKGKTDLLVPTADGVREPKNRRVEIVLPQ